MGKAYPVTGGTKAARRKAKGKDRAKETEETEEPEEPAGTIIPGQECDLCVQMGDTCRWDAKVSFHYFPR